MSVRLLVVLCAASWPASGATFRGLDFGSQCSVAPAHEIGLGSNVVADQGRGGNNFKIWTEHLGRKAEILYGCDSDGRLNRGTYSYQFGTYEEASAFYVEIRSNLIEELGRPYMDSMSPELAEAMRKAQQPINDLNRYLAMWAYDSHTISIHASRRIKDLPESSVAIVYRSKAIGGSN